MAGGGRRGGPGLVLVLEAGEGALDRLTAVLGVTTVASVIVKPCGGRELSAADVLPLVAAGQKAGSAVLIAGDAGLARTVKADGVHVAVSDDCREAFQGARATVGGRALVGADAGRSRHDAMTLGELGADYVAFGIPAFVKDRETALERQVELIGWWAEIFEPPCVAMDVPTVAQAAALADAGADFVSLTVGGGVSPAYAAAMAREWAGAVAPQGVAN